MKGFQIKHVFQFLSGTPFNVVNIAGNVAVRVVNERT